MSKEFYAHSPKPEKNISGHFYKDHISEVIRLSSEKWKNLSPFKKDSISAELVEAAACYHDLGKLDEANQDILSGKVKSNHLPVNHVDAGVKLLLDKNRVMEAFMVYAHHIGLQSWDSELTREDLFCRDSKIYKDIDKNIGILEEIHKKSTAINFESSDGIQINSAQELRFAFSCLVDADHFDTARHYQNEYDVPIIDTKWEERLIALDSYVQGKYDESLKNPENNIERSNLRNDIYFACKNAEIEPPIRSCESPVGSGKTTAVMAHLLKVAKEKNLRHIFVVLPFTNIIKQSVEVYRKALVLHRENPEDVVSELHHQVEFSNYQSRHLAQHWKAPIIVTTAVQFFETMANNTPASLRKFHELPGSAIFIDESHTALPTWFWPQAWKWMKELAKDWYCYFVLGSGSLARFWEHDEFSKEKDKIYDLIPNELQKKSLDFESQRIVPVSIEKEFELEEFIDYSLGQLGPRLIIMNTVQSAAVIASEIRKKGFEALHLSTSLAPIDREPIIEEVKRRLSKENGYQTDWTLVATSCVEAGMDFSFQSAFRESCTISSLIQVGGRVNRNAERKNAKLFDFKIKVSNQINSNPSFKISRKVLSKLFKNCEIDKLKSNERTPSEIVTLGMKWELMNDDREFLDRVQVIEKAENNMNYPKVAELCKVISSDTRLVIVKESIIETIRNNDKISFKEIVKNSVQIWANKIDKLPIFEFINQNGLYYWGGKYDKDFLGYMESGLDGLYFVL